MRQYELMVVLRHEIDPTDTKKISELVQKLIEGEGIILKDVTVMGKKLLAYPIEKQTEGVYVLAHIEAPALHIGAIEQRVKLSTDVLRYLLTVKE